jgi:glycerophosphoryl diester phosphodiesterase
MKLFRVKAALCLSLAALCAGCGHVWLAGRAVLPAATFRPGPTCGSCLGPGPISGQAVPFVDTQPVQGFSAVIEGPQGTYLVMSDNGFGSLENSSDYVLSVYTIRPDFKTASGGAGTIAVEGVVELHDPDGHVPFAITREFTQERILTGADFDIESFRQAPDGTFWFGDEFGPFLLHTDGLGRVLEPPYSLPDPDGGGELRSPQSPLNEEGSGIRIMNAVAWHAQSHGASQGPLFSPWHLLLADENPATFVPWRETPPAGSGLTRASSEIFDVALLQSAGHGVIAWTVNEEPRMKELLDLGVRGIITDRPDILRKVIEAYDRDGDAAPDLVGKNGLLDASVFDGQGHRGSRGLRPENTLPSMEAALDHLVSTLETDTVIAADGVPLLSHDPYVEPDRCRESDGTAYGQDEKVPVMALDSGGIQGRFICDRLQPDFPAQRSDPALSPVSTAFAEDRGLAHVYAVPTLAQLFDFVKFYADYYDRGEGASHPEAGARAGNAGAVRFNVETKISPMAGDAGLAPEPEAFVQALVPVIEAAGMAGRTTIQSFDFRTLLLIQEKAPRLGTVFLFGDHAGFAEAAMKNPGGKNPWLGFMAWPYRRTALDFPFRVQKSGGIEGMALSADGKSLLCMLEKPLAGSDAGTLLIYEFDLASRAFTGAVYVYRLDERGVSIGDFLMIDDTRGLVIERDDSQADLGGFKAVMEVTLRGPGESVEKKQVVDLLALPDPKGISKPVLEGDVGTGPAFAFPFWTIEGIVLVDDHSIGVVNDNNFPFSVGRHAGSGLPDDNEFIVIDLGKPLVSGVE